MIVGADARERPRDPRASANLYGAYRLQRVYYSAFSPIPDASRVPAAAGAAAGCASIACTRPTG